MRMIFCVLSVAMGAGVAAAQESGSNPTAGNLSANGLPGSNFEACVSESRLRRTDARLENYLSYKCDGAIARRLAARPDQCAQDVTPSLRNIDRRARQFEDGIYHRMVWRTQVCAGMCEARYYNDGREPKYLCEVRRHVVAGKVARPQQAPVSAHKHRADAYQPQRRSVYRPLLREYPAPAPSRAKRRTPPIEAYAAPRRTGRWLYSPEPEWYVEYGPGADY